VNWTLTELPVGVDTHGEGAKRPVSRESIGLYDLMGPRGRQASGREEGEGEYECMCECACAIAYTTTIHSLLYDTTH